MATSLLDFCAGQRALLGDPSRGVYLQDNWIVAFGD